MIKIILKNHEITLPENHTQKKFKNFLFENVQVFRVGDNRMQSIP